jgi:5'-deoxynucleotidase YfbR-like HD superfamily hydrolase
MDLLEFAEKVRELKNIKRTGWIIKGVKEPESVADHSFMLAVLAYVYSKKLGLDAGKAVKMALIHDMCEACCGDIPDIVRDEDRTVPVAKKKELEAKGMKKMLALLPEETSNEMRVLWKEFDERKTKEAKLVRDLDKLDMCMQALQYAKKHGSAKFAEFFEDGKLNIKTQEIKAVFGKIHSEYRALSGKNRKK